MIDRYTVGPVNCRTSGFSRPGARDARTPAAEPGRSADMRPGGTFDTVITAHALSLRRTFITNDIDEVIK
jgi:hypothetical protein